MSHRKTASEPQADSNALRILLVEDNFSDAELIRLELKQGKRTFVLKVVDSERDFADAIFSFAPDIILSDFSLPQFTAFEALSILQHRQVDTPFILVTGSQSEEVAVDCIKRGADDYILKQSLMRLPMAIAAVLKNKEAERHKATMERELKDSNAQLRALSGHLQKVREEERTRIAREIHDELGQTLTGLRMDVSWMEQKLLAAKRFDREFFSEQIHGMANLIDDAIQNVRKLATELRPRVLDDLGLIPTFEWQTSEFSHRTGIECTFETNVDSSSLDADTSTAFFRILQESLTNVARHSGANRVDVSYSDQGDSAILEVIDNGNGMHRVDHTPGSSLGILGMRERAALLGGTFEISSRDGEGTAVTVTLPVARTRD